MEKITNQIKKHIINSTPKTHFIKLTNIFSIFIFIFLYTSFVSLSSYTHHFTTFNDRHYIFLLCNGILVFLIINFDSTHGSSSKTLDQPMITYQTNHQPVLAASYPMEPIAATLEEQKEETKDQDEEIERNEKWVCVVEDHGAVLITRDQVEDQKSEIHNNNVVNHELETNIESKEAAETEEFNKRCAEFISKMRERMKVESSHPYGQLQLAKIFATLSS